LRNNPSNEYERRGEYVEAHIVIGRMGHHTIMPPRVCGHTHIYFNDKLSKL